MFPQFPDDLSALSNEELQELHDQAVAAFNEGTADAAQLDAETIAGWGTVADKVDEIRGIQSTRADEAAALADQLSTLADRVNLSNEPEAEANGDQAETPAEPEAPAEGNQPEETPRAEPEAQPANEPVLASAKDNKPAPKAPTAAQLQRNAPIRTQPRAEAPESPITITAAGDLDGVSAGSRIKGIREIAELMVDKHRSLGRGNEDNVKVATFHLNAPEDRRLRSDMNASEVRQRVEAFDRTPNGIVAAGGLCAPVTNYYDQMVIAEAVRPVRDSLANFQADRGGIKWNPTITMSSVTSGVGVVSAAQDAAGGSPANKNCFTVTCTNAIEIDVAAVYNCLTFGNFGARAWPENVEAWAKVALALQARTAEQLLLDRIAAGSTTVTSQGLVGAGRELFARLGQAASGFRSRHRMLPTAPIRVMLPAWTLDLVQSDFARSFTDVDGLISMDQADINKLFGTRNLSVTWYIDSKTGGGQIFGASNGGRSTAADGVTTSGSPTITSASGAFSVGDIGKTVTGSIAGIPAGATITAVASATSATISANATATTASNVFRIGANVLAEYPTTVYSYMFAEGSWLHLDAGTLDLGVVRDSTTNTTNQFKTFTETFEEAALIGPESLEIVLNLSPTGAAAASVAVNTPILN